VGVIDDFAGIAGFLASAASDFVTELPIPSTEAFDHGLTLELHAAVFSTPANEKSPGRCRGFESWESQEKSVFRDDRSRVEPVIELDQHFIVARSL